MSSVLKCFLCYFAYALFELIINVHLFYMASSAATDVDEDLGDVDLTTSNSGQEYEFVADCAQCAKDRSMWRFLVSVSVTSDPQTRGRTKARQGLF